MREKVDAKGRVLTLLEAGAKTMSDIIRAGNMKHGTAHTTVVRLRECGVVRVAGVRKCGGNRLAYVYEIGSGDAAIPWA